MEVSEHPRKTTNHKARKISLSGYALINSPRLNKGTAFSDAERDDFASAWLAAAARRHA